MAKLGPDNNFTAYIYICINGLIREEQKGGTQGRGKYAIKPLPKNGFGPPPLMIRFPPTPFIHALSFSLEETCTDQTNRIFWGLQELVLEGALYSSTQKSLGVHKILVRKIWFYPPPPKRAQNEEKLYESVENSPNWHLFRGGGERNFMDKTILWTSGRFLRYVPPPPKNRTMRFPPPLCKFPIQQIVIWTVSGTSSTN